jgi:hypothetical protein
LSTLTARSVTVDADDAAGVSSLFGVVTGHPPITADHVAVGDDARPETSTPDPGCAPTTRTEYISAEKILEEGTFGRAPAANHLHFRDGRRP